MQVTKSNDNKIDKQPVEEIIIPLETRDDTLNDLRKVL